MINYTEKILDMPHLKKMLKLIYLVDYCTRKNERNG